ncbi:MAG: iron hydrogenase small subunit [Desulfovibrionaceae bacterium]|nr:iron hydrogenase small subunit [Desulfovibrionaceae bacterium]
MSLMSQTRRLFLKGACVLTGGILLGVRMTSKAYAAVMQIKDCMNTRIKSVYAADDRFLKKASQDNVQVQQMYKLYYTKPLSEKAEHELHTKWFDRSASINELRAKGIYPNPRFAMFSKMPYPYEN